MSPWRREPVRIEVETLPPERLPPGPAGQGLYAIGDVHGRDDLLAPLLDAIETEGAGRPNLLVGLGDYIDRGPRSDAVIERLCRYHRTDFTFVPLKGNHEDVMLKFLADGEDPSLWLANGGAATLESYGVDTGGWSDGRRHGALRDALARNLPAHHRRFLDTLATSRRAGEYLFVHAGIRPGVALEDQDPQDLMWIRGPFLRATEPHGCLVVHGHTITPEADLRPNRIGIDTGAFYTGRLTALAVDGAGARLITACGAVDSQWIGAGAGA